MKKRVSGLKIPIEEIYQQLCPSCKDKLLKLAARLIAAGSIEKKLKEQWDKDKTKEG